MNITSLLIFLISFYFRLLINAYDTNELMKNYPSPFTSNNKILGLILAFDLNHFDPLALIFNVFTLDILKIIATFMLEYRNI